MTNHSVQPDPVHLDVGAARVDAFAANITRDGARTIVALRGEVDMSAAPELRDLLERLVAEGEVHLVLDLAALQFIDSSGLSAVVAAHRAAHAAGGDVRLRSPRPNTMRVLETTRLTELIPFEA